jgi:hypothetical protein
VNQHCTTDTAPTVDWSIRRNGSGWSAFRNGVACDDSEAPAALLEILTSLRGHQGEPLDLADIAIASTAQASRQRCCVISGHPLISEVTTDATGGGPGCRGAFEAAVVALGRRWFLHPDAVVILAPRVDAALREHYEQYVPEQPTDPTTHRRTTAIFLIQRALAQSAPEDGGPLFGAWCIATAIGLLTPVLPEQKKTRAKGKKARKTVRGRAAKRL